MENSQPKYQRVLEHCREIERCNQRGGRMLSIVDLVEAGTVTRELAAYCLAAIGGGASFLIGALPGGAGKTTVMGALLNFVPADVQLVPADGIGSIELGMKVPPSSRQCFICHEIGSGPFYAYLWGEELRQYFRLAGHMLATNLHADTFEQAREQICETNGVPESALRRMNLMFFLSVGRRGRGQRRIEEAWESDGRQAHRRIYDASVAEAVGPSLLVSEDALASARGVVDDLLAGGARTVQDVRAKIVRAG